MKFEKVIMFKNEKKEGYNQKQLVQTYDYDHPAKALMLKQVFFILGCVVFALSLVSYIFDVIFQEGKNIFPYGFSILSIIGILSVILLPVELYRNKDNVINYPLDKVSKSHAKKCPKRFIFMTLFVILNLAGRLVIAILTPHNGDVWNSHLEIAWTQVAIYFLMTIFMLFIVIRYWILNAKEFHLKEKPAIETGYIARDLIRELSPFSWIFLVLLMIMMFFITLLI